MACLCIQNTDPRHRRQRATSWHSCRTSHRCCSLLTILAHAYKTQIHVIEGKEQRLGTRAAQAIAAARAAADAQSNAKQGDAKQGAGSGEGGANQGGAKQAGVNGVNGSGSGKGGVVSEKEAIGAASVQVRVSREETLALLD